MADVNTEQLQAALDKLTESFNGLGRNVDLLDESTKKSNDEFIETDKKLEKFGLNIKKRNEELEKELEIQKKLDEKLKELIPGYEKLSKAQQEQELISRRQQKTTEDILKQLKVESEAIQGLTREQNAAIEAQQKLNRRKQEEADSTKHQGEKMSSTFGQLSSASGILAIAQKSATESLGATALGAGAVNIAFTGLQMGLSAVTLKFDQYIQSIDQAFQNQMAYNNAVALGADGMQKANMVAIAQMKQDAARRRQEFDQSLGFAKQLGIVTLGLGGLAASSVVTGRAIMGITGPVGIFLGILTAIGTWWYGKKAMEEKQAEQASEAAAQRLEQQSQLQDMLTKNFNELGKASMTGTRGMTGLTEASHKAGFAIKDMDKFSGIIKSTQKDMSLFGLTAVQGVDKFSEVTGNMTNKFGMYFRNLGMDQEEQAIATEKYMALQARLGLLQNKTQEQLTAGARGYIDELDKTAQMLGQSRKEQEDARAAIEGIQQLQAALMDAEERGDTSRKEEIERAIKAAASIQKLDPKVAAGLAKLVASKGAVSDEDTQKALQSIPKTLESVRKGTGTDLTREFGANQELVGTYRRTAGQFAATGVDMGLTSGAYKEANEQAIRNRKIQQEATARALKEGIKEGTPEYEKMFKEIFDRAATDERTNKVNQELIKQQKESIASDKDLLSGIGTFDKGAEKFSNAVDKFAGSSGGTVAGRADATVRQAQQAASNQVAANYTKTQLKPEEARNVLDNGSERDIAAFGGRDALTKIALSKTALAAAPTAPAPAPSAAAATAPAVSFRASGAAHAGQGGTTPSAAAAPSFSTPGAAHAGAAGYKPVTGGSGRGGQGGMGFASEAKSIEEAKAIGAATPSAPVASLPGPASTPARESLDIPAYTKKGKAKSELGDLTGRAKEFAEAAMSLGITNPIALKALVMTSAKESNLDPNSKEAGAGAYLKTLASRGIDYIQGVFPQLKGKRMVPDGKGGTKEVWGRVAKQLGFEDGVPADYLKSAWAKGDESFFDMVYGGLGTNKEAGDGYKYRGRGLVQITGREVYKNVGKLIGKDLEKDPDLVSTDFKTASQAAVGYIFATRGKETALKDLNSMKDQDSALKYVLNTVAGLGHKENEFNDPKSHLGMQLAKAQSYSALGDKAISAAKGGVVDGPTSGFPATLHGNEIITPLSPNSILEQLGKTSVEEVKSMASGDSMKEFYSAHQAVMDMLSTKLDDMIDKLERGNNYSDKLVKAMV